MVLVSVALAKSPFCAERFLIEYPLPSKVPAKLAFETYPVIFDISMSPIRIYVFPSVPVPSAAMMLTRSDAVSITM